MAKKHVVDTVRQILTDWTPASGQKLVVVFPNGDGAPPDAPEPYLFVQFPVANASRTTHSHSYLEEGAARIVIQAEIQAGTDFAIGIGEEIASLFRSQRIAGIEFLTPSSPVINDDNDQGNYFESSIVVPYLYHYDTP